MYHLIIFGELRIIRIVSKSNDDGDGRSPSEVIKIIGSLSKLKLRANKYKLSLVAKHDLKAIYAYGYQVWGEEQADKYFNAFFECFLEIANNLSQYQKVDEIKQGYRRCVCGVDSIYFRIVDDVVEIMTIVGNQDIGGV